MLRPVEASDYGPLFRLATHSELQRTWRFRGSTPSPEAFLQSLWESVLAQFVIVRRSNSNVIGLVTVYRADFRIGHAYLALVLHPEVRGRGVWAYESMLLFLNYVFVNWNFRKLYGETGEHSFESFRSGEGIEFHVEGRLSGHEWFAGNYLDVVITAIYRDEWMERARPKLDRLLKGSQPSRA
jgi:RimJ/RimL family protein N-acetyltransferase